ncbi:MAG: glycerol-3-phosphate 1-O-acyltransferase PlsY [Betaproteobacteria bacterium]|jgi:glycerol-3-phosphate acyltransferase PlsY|nr:glycerol-3-phosphate 1-O-acyltransferase PlsY [Betaproteobacteria bacterium]
MAFIPYALLHIGAYIVGSIPFAIVSSRVFGLNDPRSYGSGNPGATNVLRSGSKAAAALTLLGDCMKGWLVVWAAQALGFDTATAALAGLAAFIGHVFSVFLRFKGGKGVATALGVIVGLDLRVALTCLGVWLLIALVSRYSSAAALAAALVAPIVAYFVSGSTAITLVILTISAILIWRHAANIRRLLAGTEGKIGGRKSPECEE